MAPILAPPLIDDADMAQSVSVREALLPEYGIEVVELALEVAGEDTRIIRAEGHHDGRVTILGMAWNAHPAQGVMLLKSFVLADADVAAGQGFNDDPPISHTFHQGLLQSKVDGRREERVLSFDAE